MINGRFFSVWLTLCMSTIPPGIRKIRRTMWMWGLIRFGYEWHDPIKSQLYSEGKKLDAIRARDSIRRESSIQIRQTTITILIYSRRRRCLRWDLRFCWASPLPRSIESISFFFNFFFNNTHTRRRIGTQQSAIQLPFNTFKRLSCPCECHYRFLLLHRQLTHIAQSPHAKCCEFCGGLQPNDQSDIHETDSSKTQ